MTLPSVLSPKIGREEDLDPAPNVPARDAEQRILQATGSADWSLEAGLTTWTRERLQMAGDASERWYLWREHLDALRDRGFVGGWFEVTTREGAVGVVVEWTRGRELDRALLRDHSALDLHAVQVEKVHPIGVEPIDPEQLKAITKGEQARAVGMASCQLPDLPLRARYLPLLRRSLDAAADNQLDEELRPRQAGDRLRWSLPLRCRSGSVTVECEIAGPGADWQSAEFKKDALRAHWLVWPRFRIEGGAPWKAYYVFFGFGKRQFHAGLVWRDAEKRLRLLDDHEPGPHPRPAGTSARPVRFEEVGHTGGPPLAIALLEEVRGGSLEERGLYWVPLDRLHSADQTLNVAVDFGTSHSAAAYGGGGQERRELRMGSDLERKPARVGRTASSAGATLHVAESHALLVERLLDQGIWFPTYSAAGNGVLPSEFLLQKDLDSLISAPGGMKDWWPARDFQLAPMTSGRRQRDGAWGQILITDFKWKTRTPALVGKESELRVKYLAALLELVLAGIVTERRAGISAAAVTFLWSLRSDQAHVEEFAGDTNEACRRVTAATGVKVSVNGYYNESVAARVTGQDSRLCVVADLGGGTLDLFVSIDDHLAEASRHVVDSVQLGGNVLLDRLANDANVFLPQAEQWKTDGAAVLRAWMRTLGARRLYGDATGDFRLPAGQKVVVSGFGANPEDRKRRDAAQQMVFRYFRLVYEFIARYVVSFLVDEKLLEVDRGVHLDGIVLQLRGRGWGLHPSYDASDHLLAALSATLRAHIEARVRALLSERGLPADRVAFADTRPYHTEDPKLAPVVQGMYKSSAPIDDLRRSRSHSLVDLLVPSREGRGQPPTRVDWTAGMPLDTGRNKSVELPGGRISPPIPLSEPKAPVVTIGEGLPGIVVQKINQHLREGDFADNGVDYLVRPPRFVWEEVFHSDAFTTGLKP